MLNLWRTRKHYSTSRGLFKETRPYTSDWLLALHFATHFGFGRSLVCQKVALKRVLLKCLFTLLCNPPVCPVL